MHSLILEIEYPLRAGMHKVVSPDQAPKIYKAIKDKGLPVALVEYEGEQHGFRKVYDYSLYPPHLLCHIGSVQ